MQDWDRAKGRIAYHNRTIFDEAHYFKMADTKIMHFLRRLSGKIAYKEISDLQKRLGNCQTYVALLCHSNQVNRTKTSTVHKVTFIGHRQPVSTPRADLNLEVSYPHGRTA